MTKNVSMFVKFKAYFLWQSFTHRDARLVLCDHDPHDGQCDHVLLSFHGLRCALRSQITLNA